MRSWSWVGTGLLGVAGLFLASLMTYTLIFARSGTGGDRPADGSGDGGAIPHVAVFLPGRDDWADFRLAVQACERRNLGQIGAELPDRLTVTSIKSGKQIRFDWYDVRGVRETRDAVARFAGEDVPPIAMVGSTTTVLTVALAEPLRAEKRHGPLLAIPWATAVMVGRSTGLSGPNDHDLVPLMELDPGRTFRFCPNNRRLAHSVVDCLIARDGGRLPGRVFLVIDPFDPYSDDLATCFRQAIRERKPDVEIVERADVVDLPSFARSSDASAEPSPTESRLADAIVASREASDIRPTWVVLPLQDQPARRMITALRRRSNWGNPPSDSPPGSGPLRVVCGDAIERQAINSLAGQGGPSIWCASTSTSPRVDLGVTDDTQTLAEIVAALIWAVDQVDSPSPAPDQIREALRRIDLPPGDAYTFGRRLAFEPNGERRGGFDRVISIQPDATVPVEFVPTSGGKWEPAANSASQTSP